MLYILKVTQWWLTIYPTNCYGLADWQKEEIVATTDVMIKELQEVQASLQKVKEAHIPRMKQTHTHTHDFWLIIRWNDEVL